MMGRRLAVSLVGMGLLLAANTAVGGELLGPEGVTIAADSNALTARDVTTAFFKAQPGQRVNFAGRTLRDLDLSGLNFGQADLTGADLFGADLTSANLTGVNLSGGNLNRAIVIRADFSGANLRNANIMRPSVSTSLDYDIAESPKFAGADMRNVRMTAKMVGADFRGVNLTQANLGPHEPRADISSMPNSVYKSCDFSGATMTDVDLNRGILMFSRFVGADLRRANLSYADLSRADLSGADLTGADLTRANLDGAILSGVKGFETVRGLDTIRNLDKSIR
ncbi:MAG: pentapeptide repeat-containing protein [Hyphomicrobiaceae bacterium]